MNAGHLVLIGWSLLMFLVGCVWGSMRSMFLPRGPHRGVLYFGKHILRFERRADQAVSLNVGGQFDTDGRIVGGHSTLYGIRDDVVTMDHATGHVSINGHEFRPDIRS